MILLSAVLIVTISGGLPQAPVVAREQVAIDMLRLANVGRDDVVYAIGSVEVVTAAAQTFGARTVGVAVVDAMSTDYSAATVVVLDLSPDVNLRLEPLLRRSLRPGTRIVSHRYGIGAWRADDRIEGADGAPLFLWTVTRAPARAPGIFFVPTEQHIVEQMLDLAAVTARDVVYDLGAGDGRMIVIAAQKYGARGVGVEIDPALVAMSRQVARDAQVADKATFVEGDLFDTDVSSATVVTLFLSDALNLALRDKLQRQLRAGARIVSHQFGMGDWPPDRVVHADDGTSLYLWTIRK
jgi:hypothetical protein